MMRMIVTMVFDSARGAEINAHVPAEQARVRDLIAQGTIEALYIAAARDRVWLVVHVEGEDEAHQVMESLPLHPFASVEYAALAGPM